MTLQHLIEFLNDIFRMGEYVTFDSTADGVHVNDENIDCSKMRISMSIAGLQELTRLRSLSDFAFSVYRECVVDVLEGICPSLTVCGRFRVTSGRHAKRRDATRHNPRRFAQS